MKKCVRVLAAMLAVLTMVSLSGCTSREEADGLRTIDVCEVTHSVFYAPLYVAMSQMVMIEITSRFRIYRFKAGLLSKNDTRGDGA